MSRAAALLVAMGLATAPVHAQSGRIWRPEERVLVTWAGDLADVTLGPRLVYGLSPFNVIAYDRVARRWTPPLLRSGFPVQERPTALAHDRFRDGLWLGTRAGGLYSLSTFGDRWESVTRVAGSVERLVAVPAEGALYIRSTAGWFRIEGGGFVADPVPPSAVPAEARQSAADDPRLAARLGTAGVDPFGRRWRIGGIARGDHPDDWWIATGAGLARYDGFEIEWLRIGLPTIGAGSVARIGEQLWIGGDGARPIGGIAVADSALDEWSSYDAGVTGAPRGFVRAVARAGDAVWAAAQDGLYRLDGAGRWRRIDGLPSDASTALAPAGARVWVGTTRGLALVGGDGAVLETLLPGVQVSRIAVARDTLWIASQRGLLAVPAASSAAAHSVVNVRPADATIARGAVRDVEIIGDTVWVITELGLRSFADGAWSGPVGGARQIGSFHRLASAPGALWVAGEQGVARLDLETGAWLTFTAPIDLPVGPVTDVLPWGDDVWAATPAGAVRLRWRE